MISASAGHAGVTVAQEAQVLHAGYGHGPAQLLPAHLGQGFRSSQGGVADLAHVSVGGAHQGNVGSSLHQHGEGATAAEAFVVGVGEGGQHGEAVEVLSGFVRHYRILPFKNS